MQIFLLIFRKRLVYNEINMMRESVFWKYQFYIILIYANRICRFLIFDIITNSRLIPEYANLDVRNFMKSDEIY